MKLLDSSGGKAGVHTNRLQRILGSGIAAVFVVVALGSVPARAEESVQEKVPEQQKVLRVCQDPGNLPFSSQNLQGFENKIAALFAQELGWKIDYTWYPQRMGFIKNTLRAKLPDSDNYKCDLVIGVAVGFDLGATTQPYYRSTYAMAYVKGKGLDEVKTLEDILKLDPEKRKSLRLGVFGGSPVTDWLLQNGLIGQMVPYRIQTGDPDQYPGEMVEKDLANGTIDIAFAWGPIVGYFAKNSKTVPIVSIPLKPRTDIKFDYSIAMAVRFGEKEFKDRINQLIVQNRQKISAILEEYGVPLLNEHGELAQNIEVSAARQ